MVYFAYIRKKYLSQSKLDFEKCIYDRLNKGENSKNGCLFFCSFHPKFAFNLICDLVESLNDSNSKLFFDGRIMKNHLNLFLHLLPSPNQTILNFNGIRVKKVFKMIREIFELFSF
jgi:hypothetical protein